MYLRGEEVAPEADPKERELACEELVALEPIVGEGVQLHHVRALGEAAFCEDGQTDQLPEPAVDERAAGPENVSEVSGVLKSDGFVRCGVHPA